MTALIRYDAACKALAEAKAVDEVLEIRDQAERVKLYARQAKDRGLLADATDIHLRAERQLGLILIEAKASGQLAEGRPKKSENGTDPGPFSRVTLREAGIDKNLSSRAQRTASISERAFEMMVEQTRERIAAASAVVVSTEEKQQRRAAREQVLGACQQALPTKKYGVILADPEWRFEPWSRSTGMDRAADNHYPTSCTEVIAARDVPGIAAKDCVLFLWATAPMLPHALAVMEAWGFEYKTHFIWDKTIAGTGYWNRNRHELLLIGTNGNIPAPAPGEQEHSIIGCQRTSHSSKPETFHRLIERYFPTLPKIELNRRGPVRPGWDAWGNEMEHDPITGEITESEIPAFLRQPHGEQGGSPV